MKITAFGATGAIGRMVVERLLDAGHTVTAYVRTPSKVPAEWAGRVTTVVGEITDAKAIDSAITGADAVVSALGPTMDRTATGLPLADGNRLIVASMEKHGVRRYVGNGTPSLLDERDTPTVQTRLVGWMARTFLPRAYREMLAMSRAVTESGLDWTIVRFIAPKDGPAQGVKKVGFFGTDGIGWRVTRADIAAFTAAQVDDDRYLKAAPAISN
ncbi:NAD-dependent epimerase/dehydratase family protein [Rhodococcus sp. WS4]|nr:NAD-dependent epimerase/dehydratase family protein [Rhodococcus sp. WS4]